MLADAIKELVGLGQRAHAIEMLEDDRFPRELLVRKGQDLERIPVDPPLRSPGVDGLSDLVRLLLDPSIARDPEVYIGRDCVQAFLDRADRRERVILPLEPSERFRKCAELTRPQALTPRDAVRMLRFDLHGSTAEPVIQALSRVDFDRKSSGANTTEHGRESWGRQVEAQVQQADKVPDRFELEVPVWTTPGLDYRFRLTFGVYLDLDQERVEIRLLADELDRVLNLARKRARGDIDAAVLGERSSTKVFLGQPTVGTPGPYRVAKGFDLHCEE